MIITNIDSFENIFCKIFKHNGECNLCEYYTVDGWKKYSYKDYLKIVYGIANFLGKELVGVSEQSWIGLKAVNHPLWSAVLWALMIQGYNVVIIDNKCNEKFLHNVMINANIQAIISSHIIENAEKKVVPFEKVLTCESASEYNGDRMFANKIALCTSGTTGTPKIYVHTGKQIGSQINNILERYNDSDDLNFLLLDGKKKMFSMFPFHHISALILIIIYQVLHGTMVMIEKENISNVMTAIREGEVQIAYSVPMVWDSIVKSIIGKYGRIDIETLQNLLGTQLKFVIMGAAKASPETMRALDHAGIFSSQAYGMTEIGSLTSNVCKMINERTNGSVGKISSDLYEAKIYLDDGNIVDEGIGELLVAGDIVYSAMLINGKEVKAELLDGKYFFTGDKVQIKDKQLFILGRIKDVIVNSSGENIYPDELEEYFSEVKEYSESYVVIGIDENPVLVLHLMKDQEVEDVLKVIRILNSCLPVFKRLRAIYLSCTDFPVTSNGKIKKNEIKKAIFDNSTMYKKYEIKEDKING